MGMFCASRQIISILKQLPKGKFTGLVLACSLNPRWGFNFAIFLIWPFTQVLFYLQLSPDTHPGKEISFYGILLQRGIVFPCHVKYKYYFSLLCHYKSSCFSDACSVAATEAQLCRLLSEMRLLIACFLVGGVLAGKTNFYPSSHFLHFFFTHSLLAWPVPNKFYYEYSPQLHFTDFLNAKKGGILFTHREATRCKSSPVLRSVTFVSFAEYLTEFFFRCKKKINE